MCARLLDFLIAIVAKHNYFIFSFFLFLFLFLFFSPFFWSQSPTRRIKERDGVSDCMLRVQWEDEGAL